MAMQLVPGEEHRSSGTVHVVPGVLLRYDPPANSLPIVVDVSRSGREYPPDFRSPVPFTDVHDNASMHVEDLVGDAPKVGATLLFACFPNTYIDVNRGPLDLDANLIEGTWPEPLKPTAITKRGLGLLKTRTRYGLPMQERKLSVAEVQERLSNYYKPYHRELAGIIQSFTREFRAAWQLSFHCMSAVGAPTHADPGQARPDFCLGDNEGASCSKEFVELLNKTLQGFGYSTTVNVPYPGGELTRRYGDPKNGVNSIQIEINKKLFMDIKTFRRTEGFSRVKQDVNRLLGVVADHVRRTLGPSRAGGSP